MMKIIDLFTGMDMLGKPIPLRIGGRESHKTVHGAALTLLIVSLTVWSVVGSFNSYYDTTQPAVVVFQEEAYNYPRINLGDDGIAPIFVVMAGQNLIPPDQVGRYANFRASAVVLNPKGEPAAVETIELTKVMPCSQIRKETALLT
jgi:hypothetical protein